MSPLLYSSFSVVKGPVSRMFYWLVVPAGINSFHEPVRLGNWDILGSRLSLDHVFCSIASHNAHF